MLYEVITFSFLNEFVSFVELSINQSHHYENNIIDGAPSTSTTVNRPIEDEQPIFSYSDPPIKKTNREEFYNAVWFKQSPLNCQASLIAKYAHRLMAVDSEPTDEQVEAIKRDAASIAKTGDDFFAAEVPRERLSKRRKIDRRQIWWVFLNLFRILSYHQIYLRNG